MEPMGTHTFIHVADMFIRFVVYLHRQTNTCTHTYTYLSVYLPICLSVCLSLSLPVSLFIYLPTYLYLCAYIYICTCIHMYVCTYIYIHIYIYTHTHRYYLLTDPASSLCVPYNLRLSAKLPHVALQGLGLRSFQGDQSRKPSPGVVAAPGESVQPTATDRPACPQGRLGFMI